MNTVNTVNTVNTSNDSKIFKLIKEAFPYNFLNKDDYTKMSPENHVLSIRIIEKNGSCYNIENIPLFFIYNNNLEKNVIVEYKQDDKTKIIKISIRDLYNILLIDLDKFEGDKYKLIDLFNAFKIGNWGYMVTDIEKLQIEKEFKEIEILKIEEDLKEIENSKIEKELKEDLRKIDEELKEELKENLKEIEEELEEGIEMVEKCKIYLTDAWNKLFKELELKKVKN